jgi:hypothetical protein
MINFEHLSRYIDNDGVHFQQLNCEFKGDKLTGSIAAMKGMNNSRKDDLESLAYMFMIFYDQ